MSFVEPISYWSRSHINRHPVAALLQLVRRSCKSNWSLINHLYNKPYKPGKNKDTGTHKGSLSEKHASLGMFGNAIFLF